MNFGIGDARDFDYRGQRHREKATAHTEQKSLNAGKGQWHAQLNGSAAAFDRGNVNGALQVVDDRADHIHAHAAAGDFRDFRCGAEARLENQVHDFEIGETLNLGSFNNSLFHCVLANLYEVDAAAIVAHFDHNLRALVVRVQVNRAAGRLICGDALLGIFHAVIDGIAHEVHQRLGKRIENAFIEIRVLAGEFESDIFAALLGYIAH